MGRVIKCIGKLILALTVSCILLNIFAYVYKYTGTHIPNDSGATDFKWEENQFISNMSEGFNWSFVNNEGFNNTFERPQNIDVLFMGSSNTEGFNVFPPENYTEVFRTLMPTYSTYNIGISGHYFDICIDNLENAINEYRPQRYVVIETLKIDVSEENAKNAIEHTRIRESSKQGIIASLSKYLPIIKLMYIQVEEWRGIDEEVDEKPSVTDNRYYLKRMIEYAGTVARNNDVRLVIIYHPKTQIDDNGILIKEEPLSWFSEICDSNDIIFVDMTSDFEQLYSDYHILAHGFINTEVGAGHLNCHSAPKQTKRSAIRTKALYIKKSRTV